MAQAGIKKRKSNIELLRIVAMLMIITLHYLDKGNVLKAFNEVSTVNEYLAWIMETLCYVAVNIYVLISGYFLTYSKFSFKKLFVLWSQIVFYSWIVGVIFLVTGLIPPEQQGLYDLIFIIFPVTSGHYWFATIYVLLFLIFPFLNAGIEKMEKQQHRAAIIILMIIFSLWNTILPFTIPLADGEGMDIAWFVCLYLVAAYIRKYPECLKRNGIVYVLGYLTCCAAVFIMGLLLLFVDVHVGKLGGYATNWYSYNSFPVFMASVCLFAAFLKLEIKNKHISGFINTIAGATFGVYLIHEHRYLRYLWQTWLEVEQHAQESWMIVHLIGSVLCVFFVCTMIELIRKKIFSLLMERMWVQNLFNRFAAIESRINGEKG